MSEDPGEPKLPLPERPRPAREPMSGCAALLLVLLALVLLVPGLCTVLVANPAQRPGFLFVFACILIFVILLGFNIWNRR